MDRLESEIRCLNREGQALEKELGSSRARVAELVAQNRDMALEIENHRSLQKVGGEEDA